MPRKIKLILFMTVLASRNFIGFTSQSAGRKECYFKRLLLASGIIHYTASIGR